MRRFGVTVLDNLQPRWNVAPSQKALVVTRAGLQPEGAMVAWGLPSAGEGRSFLINARMETAAQKPTFSDAFASRRCLVVASGWYEWSAPKRPWHVQLGDGGVMGMGGLLLRRGSEDRFVIMTSAANSELTSIHHRQPLVLPPDSWHRWLFGCRFHAGIDQEAPPLAGGRQSPCDHSRLRLKAGAGDDERFLRGRHIPSRLQILEHGHTKPPHQLFRRCRAGETSAHSGCSLGRTCRVMMR